MPISKRVIFPFLFTMLSLFIVVPGASASSQKLTLNGPTTVSYKSSHTYIAKFVPARKGVVVDLVSANKVIMRAKTNASGVIKFHRVVTGDFKAFARLASNHRIHSTVINVKVIYRSSVSVTWPTDAIPCVGATVEAVVTPAISGRTVIMQYWAIDNTWVTEDVQKTSRNGHVILHFEDNSNYGPVSDTFTDNERIVIPKSGRYLAVQTTPVSLSYQGCGNSVNGKITENHSHSDGMIGGIETFGWSLTNSNSTQWNIAAVVLQACNSSLHACDPTDPNMPVDYSDSTSVTGDISGSFNWSPSHAGSFVVQIGFWADGQLIDYQSENVTVT
jgi:hypothetical protein